MKEKPIDRLCRLLLRHRFALRWFVGPSLVVLGYVLADSLLDLAASSVDTLIRYNVGQYRHALGLTFASLAIALTLATAGGPPPTRLRVPCGFGVPAVPALVHEIGGVVVLAGFFCQLFPVRPDLGNPVMSNCH